MKVVADLGDGGKLVEVCKDELASLLGYRNAWGDFGAEKFPIGRYIDISKFVAVSKFIRHTSTDSLTDAKRKLDDAVIELNAAINYINEINCFEELKGTP